ncbi:MAG: diphthine synthase [Candidatus Aenigmarchaeota archaeon]|nr:diphthine synthase [Candidatus Aenigmarchaeota archaeon]
MLTLVGLGLWDEKGISLTGLDEVKKADTAYAELYTGIWKGSIENLEKMSGKAVKILKRSDLEDHSGSLMEEAQSKNVCLLVPGDPLAATTHADLILQARKAGIETRVIHSSSVFTAVAESGLQLYKFGKTATIPLMEKTGNVLPQSVYDTIKGNLSLGLHTLLLLDIDVENGKNLGVKDALRVLDKLDADGILTDKKIIIMSKLGSAEQKIKYGSMEDLLKIDFGLPAVLVIPGKLHFAEEEVLETFKTQIKEKL